MLNSFVATNCLLIFYIIENHVQIVDLAVELQNSTVLLEPGTLRPEGPIFRRSQAVQHQPDGGKPQHEAAVVGCAFVIDGQPTTIVEPCKRTFDDPPL